MRIYVGGLGPSVQEDELKRTFTSPLLGAVESVEIIRSKGRSFAYLDFVPSSDKGLAKLFSKYNGCMWKGGRIKLEKAKEDYLSRLKREWSEDAELAAKLASQNVDSDERITIVQEPRKGQEMEKMQLKIFFPKLSKIKPVPLKGTGKHKYSFQRVEVPPLPIHFCDCEEHSARPQLVKENSAGGHGTETRGVDEEEFNMMKSILNKLLEEEGSKTVSAEDKLTEEISHAVTSSDNWQVDENEEYQLSEDDNLVINVVSQPSKRILLSEDWGHKTTARNQDSLSREPGSSSKSMREMRGSENQKPLSDKKRKRSLNEHDIDDILPSKRKAGKSSWRDLVNEKQSITFHISDVLSDLSPDTKEQPSFDHLAPPSLNEKDRQDEMSIRDNEPEKLSDVQSTKPSASEDKLARGAAWLQKSSWRDLVGDTAKTTFSLTEILPDATSRKHELQQLKDENRSNPGRGSGKQCKDKRMDPTSAIANIIEPQENGNKDSYGASKNRNENTSSAGKNHAGRDQEVPHSGAKLIVEQNDETATPMPGTNLPASNRASLGDVVISETCPFMRNSDSLKEWSKLKAALSGSLKKQRKPKDMVMD